MSFVIEKQKQRELKSKQETLLFSSRSIFFFLFFWKESAKGKKCEGKTKKVQIRKKKNRQRLSCACVEFVFFSSFVCPHYTRYFLLPAFEFVFSLSLRTTNRFSWKRGAAQGIPSPSCFGDETRPDLNR